MNQLRLEVEAYGKVDAKSQESQSNCIPIMVSITMPSSDIEAGQRKPLDIVVVLHVHSHHKVPTNWAELLRKALKSVTDKLGDNDRLAVLPVQSTLLSMSAESNKEVPAVAASAKATIRGLSSLVKTLELAESILYGRGHGKEEESRTGHIIVISNSGDDTSSLESTLLPWRFPSVHAFGFRNAHHARTLHAIASSRECTYATLDDIRGEITGAFDSTIKRITSSVTATAIEVKLKCEQSAYLSSIEAPLISYLISDDNKDGIIWASDHIAAAGTNRFIINLAAGNLPLHGPNEEHFDWQTLFKVHAKYEQVSDHLQGQVFTVKADSTDKYHRSKPGEVEAEIMRVQAVKIVTDIAATDKTGWEKLHDAARQLIERWTRHKNSICGSEPSTAISELAAEMEEMSLRLYNNYLWEEYMLSWLSHQRWQLPLPPRFMDKEEDTTNQPLEQLRIIAQAVDATAGPGTNIGDGEQPQQQGLPLLVRIMAPEMGLAKLKTPSVDLIAVLDASRGIEEKEDLLREEKYAKEELQKVKNEGSKRLQDLLVKEKNTKEGDKKGLENISMKRKEILDKTKEQSLEAEKITKKRQEKENTTKQMLELLTQAMKVAIAKLKHNDRLAILPVQCSVTEPVPVSGLLEMSKQGRQETLSKLTSFTDKVMKQTTVSANKAAQTSRWGDELKKTMKLMKSCLRTGSPENQHSASTTHSAAADGNTNLRQALTNATQMLDDRTGENKDRPGFIIVISDSNDETICQEITLSPNYIIHVFGFADMHNARAMYHLASSNNGIYDVLNDDRKQITDAFRSCINKINTVVVVNTEVEITCDSSSVASSTRKSGQFRPVISNGSNSCSISVGALHAGAVKNFMFYMDDVKADKLVDVTYLYAEKKEKVKLKSQVNVGIDGAGSKEIEASLACVETAKIVHEISAPNYKEKLEARLPREMKKMQEMCTRVMEKMQVICDHAMEKKLEADVHKDIADPSFYEKLMVRLPWQMCLKGYSYTQEAGKALARDIEEKEASVVVAKEMEKMEAELRSKITDPKYYENLLATLEGYLKGFEYRKVQVTGMEAQPSTYDRWTELMLVSEMKEMEAQLSRQMMTDASCDQKLVAQHVDKVFQSFFKIAQDRSDFDLVKDLEKMRLGIEKEMVAIICREMTVPVYYKKLMATLVCEMSVKGSEYARTAGHPHLALTMDKMEVILTREIEKMEADPDDIEKIDRSYHDKLVVLLVRDMCLTVSEYAKVAGESNLAREMENMDFNLRREKSDASYYKKLVANKLPYMLSWLSWVSFQGTSDQPSSLR